MPLRAIKLDEIENGWMITMNRYDVILSYYPNWTCQNSTLTFLHSLNRVKTLIDIQFAKNNISLTWLYIDITMILQNVIQWKFREGRQRKQMS